MAEGRGSAMVAAVVLSLMLVALHCQVAHAATYVVGGRSGWTFGLSNWPRGKNFKAGDILGNLSTYYQTFVLFVLFCWHEKKLRWHLWKKESIVSIVHRQSNSKHIRIFKETLTLKKKLYVKSWSFWRLNHVIQENSKITRIKTL